MTLHLDGRHVDEAAAQITLLLTSTQAIVSCPLCTRLTRRVHSRYARMLADLPWATYRVRLHVQVRKFFCGTPDCPRRLFTERVPAVAAPWARRTARLARLLSALGLALGGVTGSKLTAQLGMAVSPALLLRCVRSSRCPTSSAPRVVGVDDWAFHKGHRYGTILVDLERRRPIDLIPDRAPATLAAWLKAHPSIQIITRDRSAKYAEGAREGAPHAVQVADRWHLLKNLREAVQRFLTRQHACLEQAAVAVPQGQLLEHTTTAGAVAMLSSRSAHERQHNRAKRYARQPSS